MSANIEEAVREFIRVVLLAVIPVVYLSFEAGNVDFRAIVIVGVVAGLRAVEKWLHETGSRVQLPV